MEMIEPCPFCGQDDATVAYDPLICFVECKECSARGPSLATMVVGIHRATENAIAAWNTRHTEPRPANGEMIEKVARALCRQEQIEDGFSEEQAERHAASDMWMNFRGAARAAIAAYNPNERLREAAIHLRRSGDDAIVSVILVDGREVDLIRERADGNFSHIIEPSGIARALKEAR